MGKVPERSFSTLACIFGHDSCDSHSAFTRGSQVREVRHSATNIGRALASIPNADEKRVDACCKKLFPIAEVRLSGASARVGEILLFAVDLPQAAVSRRAPVNIYVLDVYSNADRDPHEKNNPPRRRRELSGLKPPLP